MNTWINYLLIFIERWVKKAGSFFQEATWIITNINFYYESSILYNKESFTEETPLINAYQISAKMKISPLSTHLYLTFLIIIYYIIIIILTNQFLVCFSYSKTLDKFLEYSIHSKTTDNFSDFVSALIWMSFLSIYRLTLSNDSKCLSRSFLFCSMHVNSSCVPSKLANLWTLIF